MNRFIILILNLSLLLGSSLSHAMKKTATNFEVNENPSIQEALEFVGDNYMLWRNGCDGDVEKIERNIYEGADPNFFDKFGSNLSPLMCAAANGKTSAVKKLIELGAGVNTPNRRGITALHLAARNGRVETVQKLLELGANPNHVDVDCFTPLDYVHISLRRGVSKRRDEDKNHVKSELNQVLNILEHPTEYQAMWAAHRILSKQGDGDHEMDLQALEEISRSFKEPGIEAAFKIQNYDMNWNGNLTKGYLSFCIEVGQENKTFTIEDLRRSIAPIAEKAFLKTYKAIHLAGMQTEDSKMICKFFR